MDPDPQHWLLSPVDGDAAVGGRREEGGQDDGEPDLRAEQREEAGGPAGPGAGSGQLLFHM